MRVSRSLMGFMGLSRDEQVHFHVDPTSVGAVLMIAKRNFDVAEAQVDDSPEAAMELAERRLEAIAELVATHPKMGRRATRGRRKQKPTRSVLSWVKRVFGRGATPNGRPTAKPTRGASEVRRYKVRKQHTSPAPAPTATETAVH